MPASDPHLAGRAVLLNKCSFWEPLNKCLLESWTLIRHPRIPSSSCEFRVRSIYCFYVEFVCLISFFPLLGIGDKLLHREKEVELCRLLTSNSCYAAASSQQEATPFFLWGTYQDIESNRWEIYHVASFGLNDSLFLAYIFNRGVFALSFQR